MQRYLLWGILSLLLTSCSSSGYHDYNNYHNMYNENERVIRRQEHATNKMDDRARAFHRQSSQQNEIRRSANQHRLNTVQSRSARTQHIPRRTNYQRHSRMR